VETLWDRAKEKANLQKHGIRFARAALALDDPYAMTIADRESDPDEERFVTVGADPQGRVLVVVYTYRGQDIRIISARAATPQERKAYGRQR
jgi:uncharacterized protein